jgi:hypothetical protein
MPNAINEKEGAEVVGGVDVVGAGVFLHDCTTTENSSILRAIKKKRLLVFISFIEQ